MHEKQDENTAAPLTTIEEQGDRRILEKANKQYRNEILMNGGKEEIDIGRTTTLTPSEEKPEQVLPNVTVQDCQDSVTAQNRRDSTNYNAAGEENARVFTNKEIVSNLDRDNSLESQEKAMQKQEYGI